jgi:hypothetical protein
MKGKAPKSGAMKHTAYSGGNSNVASEAANTKDAFKKGGKVGMKSEGVMSHAHAGRKPRKSGGGVMSSASGNGTPRGKASNY